MTEQPGDAGRARSGLHLISAVVRTFSEAITDHHGLLQTIARGVAQTIPDTCLVLIGSDDGLAMTPAAVHDTDPAVTARFGAILGKPRGRDEAPRSSHAGSLLLPVVDAAALGARLPDALVAVLEEIGARGLLIAPIRARDEVLGALVIVRRAAGLPPLDALDLEIVEDLAGHAALALATSRLLARQRDELARRPAAEGAPEDREHRQAAHQQALEASVFLDAIIENIPDMVFVKDAERLAFVRFNRAGEELLGVSRDDLLGKTDFDLFPAAQAQFFVAKDRETLSGRRLVDIPEEPIHTRMGKRWLHTKKVPVVDAAGVPRYLLGISQDITQARRAAAILNIARIATEHANRELESFTYSIAHDLRAPLRAVLGYAQAILEDHPELPESAARYLRRMHESAERMTQQIDGLLGLLRVTRAELTHDRVDLGSIAHSIVAGLAATTPERTVTVTVADDLIAYGDARLLAVALQHLLDNAWKFTSKRADARIEVDALDASSATGMGRTFFVRDNGAGFDPMYIDELFKVFHRLHREVEFPGTGIGLATVARIIHRHDGRVWAEGRVGTGASFYFTLAEPP